MWHETPDKSKKNNLAWVFFLEIFYLGIIAKHASVVAKRWRVKTSLSRAEQEAQKLAMAEIQKKITKKYTQPVS